MVTYLDSLLVLVLDFLFRPNEVNRSYWERVRLDIDHPCYFSFSQLKSYAPGKEKRLILFRKELKQGLLNRLKSEKITRSLARAIILDEEDTIKSDLRSYQSNILQVLVDILKICITVYSSTSKVFNFSASSELFRQDSPLIIQWSRSVDGFIESSSPDYHKQLSFSQERNFRKNMNNDDGDDQSSIKKRRKKRRRKHFKSPEVISSSDSSDFEDDTSNKSKDSPVKQARLDEIDKSNTLQATLDSDSSLARDLSCSDSDSSDKIKKLGENKIPKKDSDFMLELQKLQDTQLDSKHVSTSSSNKVKKDIVIKVNEAGKNLQEFPPFSDLYQDNLNKVEANIVTFLEITERLKKHALVLQNNLLPGNIETCLCCPAHCAQALVKATKDKRGPKKKT